LIIALRFNLKSNFNRCRTEIFFTSWMFRLTYSCGL